MDEELIDVFFSFCLQENITIKMKKKIPNRFAGINILIGSGLCKLHQTCQGSNIKEIGE
jgi:hypothetical protein